MPAGAIGGAGSAAGGVAGYLASQGSENAAAGDLQQALQAYQNANVPTVAEQQWNLAQEQSAGQLTPEQLTAIGMGPNALGSLSTAPSAAQQQQVAALQQLGAGGLTAQERQNLISSNQQAAGVGNSANAAVVQSMNARGMGGSGAALAAQLANGQNAANMASQQGASINAQGQNQALQAMSSAGSLAGQMQAQQFGQQAAVGQAQNAINQFNTQNQQQTAAYNTQTGNQAQAANLANAQSIGNQNTSIQNQQQAHNTGLYQQQFSDQMAQAQGEAGVLGQQSNFNQGQAANTAAMYSGIGQGVGQMAGAFSGGGNAPSSSGGYSGSTNGNNGGYARGGLVNNPGGSSTAYGPMAYAEGGEVHNQHNLEQLKSSFDRFLSEEGREAGYANGGEVSTLGMCSYAEGGAVEDASRDQSSALYSPNSTSPMPAAQHTALNALLDAMMKNGNAGGGVMLPSQAQPNMFDKAPSNEINDYNQGGPVLPSNHQANMFVNKNSNEVNCYADGGSIAPNPYASGVAPNYNSYSNGGQAQYNFDTGGGVKAKVSPEELYYSPKDARDVAQAKVSPRQVGQKVPGRAPVKGDSPKNDIVPAKLESGGVVVKRTVANSDDDDKIMNFIRSVLNKK